MPITMSFSALAVLLSLLLSIATAFNNEKLNEGLLKMDFAKIFDNDNDGVITPKELERRVEFMGAYLPPNSQQIILSSFEGAVSKDQFNRKVGGIVQNVTSADFRFAQEETNFDDEHGKKLFTVGYKNTCNDASDKDAEEQWAKFKECTTENGNNEDACSSLFKCASEEKSLVKRQSQTDPAIASAMITEYRTRLMVDGILFGVFLVLSIALMWAAKFAITAAAFIAGVGGLVLALICLIMLIVHAVKLSRAKADLAKATQQQI